MAEGYVPVDKDEDDSHSIRSTHVTPDDHTIEQGIEYTPVSASVLIGSGISLHPDYDSNGSHSNSLLYTCVRESDSGTLLEHHSHVPVRRQSKTKPNMHVVPLKSQLAPSTPRPF